MEIGFSLPQTGHKNTHLRTTRPMRSSHKQRVIFRENSHKLFLNSMARQTDVKLLPLSLAAASSPAFHRGSSCSHARIRPDGQHLQFSEYFSPMRIFPWVLDGNFSIICCVPLLPPSLLCFSGSLVTAGKQARTLSLR